MKTKTRYTHKSRNKIQETQSIPKEWTVCLSFDHKGLVSVSTVRPFARLVHVVQSQYIVNQELVIVQAIV